MCQLECHATLFSVFCIEDFAVDFLSSQSIKGQNSAKIRVDFSFCSIFCTFFTLTERSLWKRAKRVEAMTAWCYQKIPWNYAFKSLQFHWIYDKRDQMCWVECHGTLFCWARHCGLAIICRFKNFPWYLKRCCTGCVQFHATAFTSRSWLKWTINGLFRHVNYSSNLLATHMFLPEDHFRYLINPFYQDVCLEFFKDNTKMTQFESSSFQDNSKSVEILI